MSSGVINRCENCKECVQCMTCVECGCVDKFHKWDSRGEGLTCSKCRKVCDWN